MSDKTLGQIEWEARIAFYKAEGYHPDFQTSWEDLSPDQQAAMEFGANAVLEHCADLAIKSYNDHHADGYEIARRIRTLKT